MNTHKIIKSYFAFICMISSIAFLTSNNGFNASFVSIFHADKPSISISQNVHAVGREHDNVKTVKNTTPVNLFVMENESRYFSNSLEGSEKITFFESFKININTKNKQNLETLILNVEGITPSTIKEALLYVNNNKISQTKITDNTIIFKQLEAAISEGENIISVTLYLTNEVPVGARIRMSIMSEDNIVFNNKLSAPNTFYPIFGKYITKVSNKI